MFSKACEYAIKACIYIGKNATNGMRVNPKEIAKEINSPLAFTAKILQTLVKNQIINSVQGAHGGFEIKKEKLNQITLAQIVNAIDGDTIYKNCGLGLEKCSEIHPCPIHHKFKTVRNELEKLLENTTLEELALDIKIGTSFLKI